MEVLHNSLDLEPNHTPQIQILTKEENLDVASLLVTKPEPELICPLCLRLMLEPVVVAPCTHNFCKQCLETTRRGVDISGDGNSCPYCNTHYTSVSSNQTFKEAVNKLLMRCRFAGCPSEPFPIEARERHEQTCEYCPIECENGCQTEGITRQNLIEHLALCSHKKITCECGKVMTLAELQSHLVSGCEASLTCSYCGEKVQQKLVQDHNKTCQKRKVQIIRTIFPQFTDDVEFIEDMIRNSNGSVELFVEHPKITAPPLKNVLEIFNLTKHVSEKHIQDLLNHVCPTVKPKMDWTFSDGNWAWVHLQSEEGAQLLQSTLQAHGFPFVRPACSDNYIWLGRSDHLTFVPAYNTVDCPMHERPATNCVFRHTNKTGVCIRWKAGRMCDSPLTCKFGHPGKTVVELKFLARSPNQCKFCQKDKHFGWECPERTSVNSKKDKNDIEGVANALERILVNEGGRMLANRAGLALRRENRSTAAVLEQHFGGKLKKLVEAFPNKFILTNQDQPGFACIQLCYANQSNGNGSLTPTALKKKEGKVPYKRVMPLGREWAIENELLPFIHSHMKPHFEKIKNNIRTDKRLLPDLHNLVQQLYAFDKNSYVGNLKTSMKNLAESIANIQLRDYEPDIEKSSPFLDFKAKIAKLQPYNPELAKTLNLVRKYGNSNAVSNSPSTGSPLSSPPQTNEHDSLVEMFNYLTDALGIFFKSIKAGGRRNSMGQQYQTVTHPIQQFTQASPFSYHSSSSVQNFQPLQSYSPMSQPKAFTSSYLFAPTGSQNQFGQQSAQQIPPQSLYSQFSSPFSQPSSDSNSSQSKQYGQNASSHMQQFASQYAASFIQPQQFPQFSTQQYSQQQYSQGSPTYTRNSVFGSSQQFGSLLNHDMICRNCGAVGSHTSSNCFGCGKCGRTNHTIDQCTSKLPRCGYCSKQNMKGLGHRTSECMVLQQLGKGV